MVPVASPKDSVGENSIARALAGAKTPRPLPAKKALVLPNVSDMFGVLAKKSEENKLQKIIHLEQIEVACGCMKPLIEWVAGIYHFFVAGNQEFVAVAKDDENLMGLYNQIIENCRRHHQYGNCLCLKEEDGGYIPMFADDKMLHCAVPSRVATMQTLFDILSKERSVDPTNGDILAPLDVKDIVKLGVKLGALVLIEPNSQIRFVYGEEYKKGYAPDSNGGLIGEYLEKWNQLVADMMGYKTNKKQKRAKNMIDMMKELTTATLQELVESGGNGVCLIDVPDQPSDDGKYVYKGGQMLLSFVDHNVKLYEDDDICYVTGHDGFCQKTIEEHQKGAYITLVDVKEMLDINFSLSSIKPSRFVNSKDGSFYLWNIVWRHIKSVRAQEEKLTIEELVERMSEEDDIPEDQFDLDISVGASVLTIEKFKLKIKTLTDIEERNLSPVAVRVQITVEDGVRVIEIIDITENLDFCMRKFLPHQGEGKVESTKFPVEDIKGIIKHFLNCWQQQWENGDDYEK